MEEKANQMVYANVKAHDGTKIQKWKLIPQKKTTQKLSSHICVSGINLFHLFLFYDGMCIFMGCSTAHSCSLFPIISEKQKNKCNMM